MTITHTDDRLSLENKITTEDGDLTIKDSYVINGKEVEFTQKRDEQEAKGKRTSKWSADGSGFDSSEEITVEGGDGLTVTQQVTRSWAMAADGKTFTLELTLKGPNGTQHTKRTFVKKTTSN